MKTIGEKIKMVRMAHGKSMETIARLAGITINTYARIERGATKDPKASTIKAVCSILGVSSDEILDLKDLEI